MFNCFGSIAYIFSLTQAIKSGKLDWVVRVDIDPSMMKEAAGDKDIWIYEGDVDLKKFNNAIEKCKFKSCKQTDWFEQSQP